jgi:hypothetical protein
VAWPHDWIDHGVFVALGLRHPAKWAIGAHLLGWRHYFTLLTASLPIGFFHPLSFPQGSGFRRGLRITSASAI